MQCEREPDNASDRYAVAVKKNGNIIGHLVRKISRAYSLFLRIGNEITYGVTGYHRYSIDLSQGWLEVHELLNLQRLLHVKKPNWIVNHQDLEVPYA